MRRRDVIISLGGVVGGWLVDPLPLAAQGTARRPTVAVVFGAAAPDGMIGPNPTNLGARGFVHGMRDLGWIDGHTAQLIRMTALGQPELAPSLLRDIISQNPDVIVVVGMRALVEAAQRSTRTIPTVAIFLEDPVKAGFVAAFARPGGNLTGPTATTGREFDEKRLQFLKELAPSIRRVGFLGTPSAWDTFRIGASPSTLPSVYARVDGPDQFDEAFNLLKRERVDAIMVSYGPVLYTAVRRIATFTAENKLPAVYPWREAVDAGGLMSHGFNVEALYRQASTFVDRILRGEKAADLAIEQPRKFDLVINAKTAKGLNLPIPPALLALADEVVE